LLLTIIDIILYDLKLQFIDHNLRLWLMKKEKRRRPRSYTQSKTVKQQTMDDNYYSYSSTTYLTETFVLNSYHRVVSRKGKGRKPDPSFRRTLNRQVQTLSRMSTGRKCSDIDLQLLTQHFEKYVADVNLILQKVYSSDERAEALGKKLKKSKSRGYVVLMKENNLKWSKDNEFGQLVFGRMHRNAQETAARLILADHTRRDLVRTLVTILNESQQDIDRLLKNKRVPADLVRRVRDNSETKKNGSGFHYALSACKQVRRVLDELILSKLKELNQEIELTYVSRSHRGRQRAKVQKFWKSSDSETIKPFVYSEIDQWNNNGFLFTTPKFRASTQDFSASTENTTGQGYWFRLDPERPDEIIIYVKTPPGVLNNKDVGDSPYRSRTIRFRFLNWLPLKVRKAQDMAEEARNTGDLTRAQQLDFRAALFLDMNEQLMNTIALHHSVRELSKLKSRKELDIKEISKLEKKIGELQGFRRSAPPEFQLRGNKVILSIPFLSPDRELLKKTLRNSRITKAGVDRGLRYPVVVSVRKNDGTYDDIFIGFEELFEKRERLRQHARELKSQIDRRRNNWEKKHPGLKVPVYILKKECMLASVWRKVRRLDREISHQVACQTTWFCEQHDIKTIYFEDLRYFQGKGGMHTFSWNLSTNLWGLIIEGVRYRRQAMGHRRGGVWTVNPAWTSQKCSQCGEKGRRVESSIDTLEAKGGEYFYCPNCRVRLHADINAAHNIIHVQSKSSAVSGRT
jgi:transposase